jgi:hypothetical protein
MVKKNESENGVVITDVRVAAGLLEAGFVCADAVVVDEEVEHVLRGTLTPPPALAPPVSFMVPVGEAAPLVEFLTTPQEPGAPLILRHPDGTEEQTGIRVHVDMFEKGMAKS